MMSQTINFPSLLKWWLTLLLGSVAAVSPCDCFGLVIRYFRDYATDGSWPITAILTGWLKREARGLNLG